MMELGNYCFYIYIKQPKNKQMKRIFFKCFSVGFLEPFCSEYR